MIEIAASRYEDAIAELQKVTQKCTDAWAQTYNPILHGLSGGFDSAVVLGCLRNSPAQPQVTCLNQFTAASHDDERGYARIAAGRAGLTLLELPMDSAADQFDSRLLAGPKTLKPAVPGLFRLLETELINRIAAATGARTLWTGQGGDHIFLQTAGSSSAGDYLATRGLRLGFVALVGFAGLVGVARLRLVRHAASLWTWLRLPSPARRGSWANGCCHDWPTKRR